MSRKKFHTQLTPPGWTLLFASVLGLVIGRLFGIFEVTLIAVSCPIFFLLAIPTNRYLKRIEIKCQVTPTRVQCFEKAEMLLEIMVENPVIKPLGVTIGIQDIFKPSPDAGDPKQPEIFYSLAEGANTLSSEVQLQKRGEVLFGPIKLELTDPFGLLKSTKQTDAYARLLVHPQVVSLNPPQIGYKHIDNQKIHTENHQIEFAGQKTEFHSLKDYQPGDDLRLIHWASTAKYGNLVLKQNTNEYSSITSVSIFLDNRAMTPVDVFEDMVSAAASIAHACELAGYKVQLQTASGESAQSNEYEVLDFLSLVQQVEAMDKQYSLNQGALDFMSGFTSDACIALLGELAPQDEYLLNEYAGSRFRGDSCSLLCFRQKIKANARSIHMLPNSSFTEQWEAVKPT